MIALLRGRPLLTHPPKLVIMTGGVGYGVHVGAQVWQHAQQVDEITLYIHTHVREEKLDLYGFLTGGEQKLFELVQNVSGVGPAIALSLVDAGSDRLVTAVQNAEVSYFTAVPRVGKKLAQKIIIDLKSKLGGLGELNLGPETAHMQDFREALLSLGFTELLIDQYLREQTIDDIALEVAIKDAIKHLHAHR